MAVLALPGVLGAALGYRVQSPRLAAWAAAAVGAAILALATPVLVESVRAAYLAFAVLYPFVPVGLGRAMRQLRERPREPRAWSRR